MSERGRVIVPIEQFRSVLPQVCKADTAFSPDEWREDNPFIGHCAVVTAFANELYGGKILRASLENTVFAPMKYHYKNEFPDGEEDFTKEQFGEHYPSGLVFIEREREALFEHPEMVSRYTIFSKRFRKALSK